MFYLRQVGSCVWWIGLSDWPGGPLGAKFTLAFRGEVTPDFRLSGEWAYVVRRTNPAFGSVPETGKSTFSIDVVLQDGQETIVLKGIGGPADTEYGSTTLNYVGPLPIGEP